MGFSYLHHTQTVDTTTRTTFCLFFCQRTDNGIDDEGDGATDNDGNNGDGAKEDDVDEDGASKRATVRWTTTATATATAMARQTRMMRMTTMTTTATARRRTTRRDGRQ